MRSPFRAILLATFLIGLPACTSPDSGGEDEVAREAPAVETEGPVRGDWMIRWLLSDPQSMNPLTSNDLASSTVQGLIMTSLLTLDPETLEQIPLAAREMPEVSGDHLTYRFRLRPDVTFADGKPFTAEDVLFSLKAIKVPEVDAPHLRNYYVSIVDARKTGPREVEFQASEPYFRNSLVLGSMTILPQHFYDPEGELRDISVGELHDWESLEEGRKEKARRFGKQFNRDYHRKILGAGGYEIEDPERDIVTQERIDLRHRDDFWAPGKPLLGDGWVERIVFRIINDPNGALVALKGGTLDVMGLQPIQHVKQTTAESFQERFAKEKAYSPGYTYIGWNQKKRIFQDRRVRQALAHLVDRGGIIEKVLLGLGEEVNSPIYRFRPEYNEDLEGYDFDPKRARELLEEAGWTDSDGDGVRDRKIDGERVPLSFEIISNAGNDIRKNVGLIVIDEYRRNGIAAKFRQVDWSILLERVNSFDYDAVILGWAMSATAPDLFQVWHSSQAVQGGSNHVAFRNEEVDEILETYRRTFDEEKRIRMYHRLQEILEREAPYVFLFMQENVTAYQRRFRDTKWYPSGGPLFNEWWVPKPLQKYGQ